LLPPVSRKAGTLGDTWIAYKKRAVSYREGKSYVVKVAQL